MKMNQEATFSPITIVLETEVEANVFWDLVPDAQSSEKQEVRTMALLLSDYFSNEAKL